MQANQMKYRLLDGINNVNPFNMHKVQLGKKTSLPGVRNKYSFESSNKNFYYRERGANNICAQDRVNQ